MSSKSSCGFCYSTLAGLGCILKPFILLAMRLFWGYLFIKVGMTKFADIHATAAAFEALSIPVPTMSAYLVAFCEVVGGAMLMVGFGARLAAIPLIIITVTAYLTAHVGVFSKVMENPELIVKEPPFNYLLTALIVLAFGPGLFSIDAIIKGICMRRCNKECESPEIKK